MIPLHIPPLKLKDAITFPTEDYVSKLEDYFSRNFKKGNVIFTSDGRNAIYHALKTIKILKEKKVYFIW